MSRYEYVGISPTIYPRSSQKPTDIGTYEVSVYNTVDAPGDYARYSPANTLQDIKQFSIIASNTGPSFSNPGPINLCELGTYYLAPSTTDGSWTTSTPTVATVNSNGYVTALSQGTTVVSLTTTGGTVTATVTVSNTSNLSAITNGQASYKFNNYPQGPLGLGTVIYKGYNGFNYSSSTQPTNPGFYEVNNVDLTNRKAGCPYTFYIYRCTTCSDVPALPPVAPTPRP